MKNIHVLTTDKPSRLAYDFDKLILNSRLLSPILYKTQNIYITSDEEIKEGDWYFDGTDLIHKKTKYNDALVDGNKNAKKIILTTDLELQKDGVQAIDDEFLEWFVKNPSCDNVEVIYEPKNYLDVKKGWEHSLIIPKEEPKQLFTKGDKVLFTGQMIDENVVDKLVTVFYTMGTGELDDMSDIMDEYTHIYRVWNKDLKHIPKEEPNPFELPKALPDDVFYESLEPKQETLEEFIKEELEDVFFTNISERKKAERLIELGAKWQIDKQDNFIIGFLEFIEGTYSYSNIFDYWYLHADTSKTYTKKELLKKYIDTLNGN